MKLSKIMHVASIVSGLIGVATFFVATVLKSAEATFGISKADALACSAVLMLMAIWFAVGTIHHMKLEEKGEII